MSFVPVVVPGASADELSACLQQLHLVGSVIDGSKLGVRGVAVARIVGDEHSLLVVEDFHSPTETSESSVLEHVAGRWTNAVLGDAAAEAYELTWPVVPVGSFRTVAVTPPADLMLSLFAKGADVTLHEARVGECLLVGLGDGHDLYPDVLVDVLTNAKGRSVVLWRTDAHVGLHVMNRGKHAESHLWEPTWNPFGHTDLDDLRDPGVIGDAAAMGSLLGLTGADIVSLRALMRQPSPDLPILADLLGLPSEVVDVLEGRTTVADLPTGSIPEPRSFKRELVYATRASEHDPAWFRWIDTGFRELKPWYIGGSLLTIVIGVVFVVDWIGGGSAFRGVVGLVLALWTAIELPLRWWRKRRRP